MTSSSEQLFFDDQVKHYNAVKVRTTGSLDQSPGLPGANEMQAHNIWFETQNFGWILSDALNGPRKVLLKY